MGAKYKEFTGLNLPAIEKEILKKWEEEQAFENSVSLRQGKQPFVFYEGPPSANGMRCSIVRKRRSRQRLPCASMNVH